MQGPVDDLILEVSLEGTADQVAARSHRAAERRVRRQVARNVLGSERGDPEVVERSQQLRNVAAGDLGLRPEHINIALRGEVGVESELPSGGVDASVLDTHPVLGQDDLRPRVRGLQMLVDRLVDPHVESHLALVDHRPQLARRAFLRCVRGGDRALPSDFRSEKGLRFRKGLRTFRATTIFSGAS